MPRFVQGMTLRYRIETRASSNVRVTTPITNPEGGSQFQQTTSFLVRLDVLAAPPAQGEPGPVRFRATFEKSHAMSETDAFAPEADSLVTAIDNLERHSVEFTLGSAGQLSDIKGLEQVSTDPAAAERVLSWTSVLSSEGSFPKSGIEIGQKWNTERPLTGLPLTGLIWRAESSYLRNEPCAVSAAASDSGGAAVGGQGCAVILTRFEISRHGSERSDATPENYIRNGLRTSGRWTGSGESLNSVSLADGFLVSSTQTATQDLDYEIVSASSGSRVRHAGQTKTQTEITLVPSPPRSAS
ncbi:MAG TPA: hypothetical protein VLY23_02785 [Candidatus Acidoferrum sp.]|nr:hypothetical protein [Candidatus Acidoferrum sp.]